MADFLFGNWHPGDEEPSSTSPEHQTPDCGGTSHLLPIERRNATVDVKELVTFLDGSEKATARRRWIWSESYRHDNSHNIFKSRSELIAQHVDRFLDIHIPFADDNFIPQGDDMTYMLSASRNNGAFGLHYGAFCSTILSQCNDEQKMEWLIPALKMHIVGCLAQTELGHGSNVRALQTTAVYDKSTQEFVLNTPTLRAIKWWPGGMGKTATHCAVYAQLVIDGKEYGFHVFLLQLRDEHHRPLAGIELGEIGPKVGDNFTETGFMRLTNVRIPRTWLMMKNQQVTPDGQYVKSKQAQTGAKLQYSTMLSIRAGLVRGAGYRLAQGVTIAVRYSCVREQGFVDPSAAKDRTALEHPVIHYQVQQFRVLTQLALAYAFVFAGRHIMSQFRSLKNAMDGGDEEALNTLVRELPEMHATAAGLKALCTFEAAAGLEECRKCLGGHGVMLASGVAQLALDYVTMCTAEGDRIVLELQLARFLMKQLVALRAGKKITGVCDYMNAWASFGEEIQADRCSLSNHHDFESLSKLLHIFGWRAMKSIVTANQRWEEEKKTTSASQAWNNSALELVAAARAHCHFAILSAFVAQSSNAPDEGGIRQAMKELCLLYATSHLIQHVGDWLGYLSFQQEQYARTVLRKALLAVRTNAVALTDAFEFPDNVLNSALGRHDGRVYESLYAAARASPLNEQDPFEGFSRSLGQRLDKEFIRDHAKQRMRLWSLFNQCYEGYVVPMKLSEEDYSVFARFCDVKHSLVVLDPSFTHTTTDSGSNVDQITPSVKLSQCVALCNLAVRDDRGWIAGVGVIPSYRRKGIAARMMMATEEKAKSLSISHLQLEVLSNNTPAMRLYEGVGWKPLRTVDVWHAESDVLKTLFPSSSSSNDEMKDVLQWTVVPPSDQKMQSLCDALISIERSSIRPPFQREAEGVRSGLAMGDTLKTIVIEGKRTQPSSSSQPENDEAEASSATVICAAMAPPGRNLFRIISLYSLPVHRPRDGVENEDHDLDISSIARSAISFLHSKAPGHEITCSNEPQGSPLGNALQEMGFTSICQQIEMAKDL